MNAPEHRQRAEWLLNQADGQELEQAAYTVAKAQVHATLAAPRPAAHRPGVDPNMITLAVAYTEAFTVGDKVDIRWDEKDGEFQATVWKGLSCKTAVAGSPAEALTEAARALKDWLWEPEGEVQS